jgi:hypothetical protein
MAALMPSVDVTDALAKRIPNQDTGMLLDLHSSNGIDATLR